MKLLDSYLALDLTDLQGQMCGKLLRDLGMEVVKVEPTGGDPVRRLGPFKDDRPNLETSLRFAYLNAGKRSLTLDLESNQGRELLLQLAAKADVVLQSGPPAHWDRLGLDRISLLARNPAVIVTSVSGFGLDGPYRDFLAPDLIGFAMGGLMNISGDASLPPVKAPETQSYYFACQYAALGTVLSLWQRQKDQRGRAVDISIQETIASQEHLIRAAAYDREPIHRHGSAHEHVAPANIYPARDGYVYLFATRQHWPKLLALWKDHPADLDDPKWLSNLTRREHADMIDPLVAEFTSRFDRDEFVKFMQNNGIPSLPVSSPADFQRDEHVQARGLFAEVDHPFLGNYQQIAFSALLDGARRETEPPPLLGQHSAEILTRLLGLDPSQIELLFNQGVI